jgi:hypothetical protein
MGIESRLDRLLGFVHIVDHAKSHNCIRRHSGTLARRESPATRVLSGAFALAPPA